jgi:hypothetical protein
MRGMRGMREREKERGERVGVGEENSLDSSHAH